MNLGIVIAVSDYGNLGNNLPGCVIDGKAISTILKTDSKFDDVLVITEKTNSSEVKSSLIEFINKHKDSQINDIVFYFTGHGDFSGEEFYFLLSDYDKKRRKQTSLENSELDNILRALTPQNTIKIVDACHSGTPYIKDPDSFDTYLKGTKGNFKKCYFMFSSQTDQYSYQNKNLSFFTKSIIDSIYNHTSTTIRYKDIIDHVSDAFADNSNQTPFFIVQADFTEPFCTISETLKLSLSGFLEGDSKERTDKNDKKTIIDLIKDEAEKYCTEAEAIGYLNEVILKIKNSLLNDELSDIYTASYWEHSDYENIPNIADIGRWLESNEHLFFAEAVKQSVEVAKRVPKNNKYGLLGLGLGLGSFFDDTTDEERYKTVYTIESKVKGFKSTVDLPLTMLKIEAEANYPNIKSAAGYLLPIISRTTLKIFYTFAFYEEKGWTEKKINNRIKWSVYNIELKEKNSSNKFATFIITEFSKFLLTPLVEKYGLEEKAEEQKELLKNTSDTTAAA